MTLLYYILIFCAGFFLNAYLNESKSRDELQTEYARGHKDGYQDALDYTLKG